MSQLDPGTYEIQVRDLSDFHNFHLDGPGVDRSTTVAFEGTVTWTVEFREGRYRFQCDPHSEDMFGLVTVGNPPPVTQPPPPPPSAKPTPVPAAKKLTATVGPRSTIALRTAAGAHVHGLKAGRYAITVRDRTAKHNFHLSGAGVNKKTGVAAGRDRHVDGDAQEGDAPLLLGRRGRQAPRQRRRLLGAPGSASTRPALGPPAAWISAWRSSSELSSAPKSRAKAE